MHSVFAGLDPRPDFVGELVEVVPRAFGTGHLSRPLPGKFCSASKLSAALWSKTSARCLAFSSGHTSTVDSVPSGAIRTTCHPMALASYRSRFILRICAPTCPFSSPEVCQNRHRGRLGQATLASPALAPIGRATPPARSSRTHRLPSWSHGEASNERGRQLRRPYSVGSFAISKSFISAATRNCPAFLIASIRFDPGGNFLAFSSASDALASQSCLSTLPC